MRVSTIRKPVHDSHPTAAIGSECRMSRAAQAWESSRLAALPGRYKSALVPLTVERAYSRGDTLGWNSTRLSLVVHGQICAYMLGSSGRRIALRYYGRGDVLGLHTVINPAINRAPLRMQHTATRESHVIELSAARLRAMADRDPETLQLFNEWLARDMIDGHHVLTDDIFFSVRQLLAHHLLQRAVLRNGKLVVPATQEELADAIGSVRSVVARVLSDFRVEGLVDRDKGGLTIADAGGLCAEAE
jgi:CRP/FNR family cyclic AMP-dependent transcriptional regulator